MAAYRRRRHLEQVSRHLCSSAAHQQTAVWNGGGWDLPNGDTAGLRGGAEKGGELTLDDVDEDLRELEDDLRKRTAARGAAAKAEAPKLSGLLAMKPARQTSPGQLPLPLGPASELARLPAQPEPQDRAEELALALSPPEAAAPASQPQLDRFAQVDLLGMVPAQLRPLERAEGTLALNAVGFFPAEAWLGGVWASLCARFESADGRLPAAGMVEMQRRLAEEWEAPGQAEALALLARMGLPVEAEWLDGVWTVMDRSSDGVLQRAEFEQLLKVVRRKGSQATGGQQGTGARRGQAPAP